MFQLTASLFVTPIRTILEPIAHFGARNTHRARLTLELFGGTRCGGRIVTMNHPNVIDSYQRIGSCSDCCFDVNGVGGLLTNEHVAFAPTVALIA